MRITICAALLVMASAAALADDADTTARGWQLSSNLSLSLTQAAYSDSWQGGEVGSFSWTFNSNTSLDRQLSEVIGWNNTFKINFGQTYREVRRDDGTSSWDKPQKSTDLIDIESVLDFDLHGFVDPYLALRIESRFTDESIEGLRRYFSPTVITESGGILRHFIKQKDKLELTSRLGFAIRQRLVDVPEIAAITGDDTTYSGASSWESSNDGGIESVTDFLAQINERLKYTSKLTLFRALFFSESDSDPDDNWKQIDVNSEHILTAQVTSIIQTSFYLQFIFDREQDARVQIKQTLGLGIAVTL